jgi:hypothetical protein
MTETEPRSDAQDLGEKEKSRRKQSGGLAGQNLTRPAPIERQNEEKKRPEPTGLENQNITKSDLTD